MHGSSALDRPATLAAWELPVTSVRLVDGARAEALARIGISTVGDLLHHFPFRYLDLTETASLADARVGSDVTVVGRVHEVRVKKPRPRLTITEVALVDGTGVLLGVWFNQPYRSQQFVQGERVAFAGRVALEYGLKQIVNPFFEKLPAESELPTANRILPVHRSTEGLSTAWLRRLVTNAVVDFADVPDHLPSDLRALEGLVPLAAALHDIHLPDRTRDIEAARRRLAFDELLVLQLGLAIRRHVVTRERPGFAHNVHGEALDRLSSALSFALTADQERAVREILEDMSSSRPMNRMLLGDVGTGKTVVAAHALCAAADSSAQAAMMAPTEVLAIQYAEKVGPLLDAIGVPWALLTGSTKASERRELLNGVADGSIRVLFGTHALLEESVRFNRLTLAIVDEQHRFGVGQRLGLRGKGPAADLLVMTATPIPRSLALTLYGDLDTSYLKMRPHGDGDTPRVVTHLVNHDERPKAYERVREEVRGGRQAYVICALVDESDAAQARAASKEAERLRNEVFPDLRVGLLTGRMRSQEKASVMREFREGLIDVLVSTTVVEVGVDVPNATLMIVEDAERFGLAQLHQLRGRVGRGEQTGEFLLFADARTGEGRERMDAILSTSDGFALAEQDLRLRGEGQLLGERQSGLPELRLASVLDDIDLLNTARACASQLVESDPHLTKPENAPLARVVRAAFDQAWDWVSSG